MRVPPSHTSPRKALEFVFYIYYLRWKVVFLLVSICFYQEIITGYIQITMGNTKNSKNIVNFIDIGLKSGGS